MTQDSTANILYDASKLEPSRYEHDCNSCKYLGRHEEYDLYFCSNEPTVVARYSDHGPDYIAGLMFAKPDINMALHEAKIRSIKYGFIKLNS